MTVSIHQAQLQLANLIERTSRGEEIAIAREDGQIAARLVPAAALANDSAPGFLKGKIEIVADDASLVMLCPEAGIETYYSLISTKHAG